MKEHVMKNILLGISMSVLMLAACSPVPSAGEDPVEMTSSPIPPFATGPALTPIEDTVLKKLAANLGLKESDISVVSNEEVEFKDTCLGVALQDAVCAPVETLGHIVILEAEGIQYEYHTSDDGARIQPAYIALSWKREGGFAGFCDYLTVFRSGEVYRSSCMDGQYPEERLIDLLSAEEIAQLTKWQKTYGEIEIDVSDPPDVCDRMVMILKFSGVGSDRTMNVSDRQEMLNFAQEIYQRFSS
jgi:hypothetical protein